MCCLVVELLLGYDALRDFSKHYVEFGVGQLEYINTDESDVL